MTHRFIPAKPRTTRAAAESAHQAALNALLDVARRQGASTALEIALKLAAGQPCAVEIGRLLTGIRETLDPIDP